MVTRQVAEQLAQVPDFGLGREERPAERRTAREIDALMSIMSQGANLSGLLFRESLANLYRAAWATLAMYATGDLAYWQTKKRKVLPIQAVKDVYSIEPSGSTEAYNRQIRVQRARALMEMFKGDPDIDQMALKSEVLSSLDERLPQKLLVGNDINQAIEAEDEAIEIVLMLHGHYPAVVQPDENHGARALLLMQKLQALTVENAPVDPIGQQLLAQHLAQHLQYLQQQNPQAFAQLQSQAMQMMPQQPMEEAV